MQTQSIWYRLEYEYNNVHFQVLVMQSSKLSEPLFMILNMHQRYENVQAV